MRSSSVLGRLAVGMAFVLLCCFALAFAATGGYHLLNKYPFGAAEGSTREYFDYITVDSSARRVYLSHGTEIKVIDADNGSLIGNITGLKQDHGVAIASEFGRGFITDGAPGKSDYFRPEDPQGDRRGESRQRRRLRCLRSGLQACLCHEWRPQQLHGDRCQERRRGGDHRAGWRLLNSPSPTARELFMSIWKTKTKSSPLIPTRSPSSRAGRLPRPEGPPPSRWTRKHRRLFSAGRNPQMLVVMDADSGKVIQSFPISAGVDAAAFEPETGMIFASTREGMIHIFHEDSPDKFSEVETVKTEFGAKTMGLDTKTHNLFVDTADFGSPASAGGRPTRSGRSGNVSRFGLWPIKIAKRCTQIPHHAETHLYALRTGGLATREHVPTASQPWERI